VQEKKKLFLRRDSTATALPEKPRQQKPQVAYRTFCENLKWHFNIGLTPPKTDRSGLCSALQGLAAQKQSEGDAAGAIEMRRLRLVHVLSEAFRLFDLKSFTMELCRQDWQVNVEVSDDEADDSSASESSDSSQQTSDSEDD
jgi:hypothetical protein